MKGKVWGAICNWHPKQNQPKVPKSTTVCGDSRFLRTSWKVVLAEASLQEWTVAMNFKQSDRMRETKIKAPRKWEAVVNITVKKGGSEDKAGTNTWKSSLHRGSKWNTKRARPWRQVWCVILGKPFFSPLANSDYSNNLNQYIEMTFGRLTISIKTLSV